MRFLGVQKQSSDVDISVDQCTVPNSMCVLGICQVELISYSTWQKTTYHIEHLSLIAPIYIKKLKLMLERRAVKFRARTRLERLASTRRLFPNEALVNKSPSDMVAGPWVMID